MKTLLTWLTYGLVGVIVVVLASYLILIAAALIRANRNLTKLVGGLEASRDNTAPLADDLDAINTAAVTLRDRLMAVDQHLSGVIRSVRG
jgi:hypothetical protein